MSVIESLSTSLKLKVQDPNIAIAKEIVETNNQAGILELIEALSNKKLANDCIKVLYEIGYLNPKLIEKYANVFLDLLSHKENRLQWGAMIALAEITKVNPEFAITHLNEIIKASNEGSVITKDQAFNILVELAKTYKYYNQVFSLMNEQLMIAPNNQFPKYVEQTFTVYKAEDCEVFIKTIELKIVDIDVESKRKRADKILQKLKKEAASK